MFLSFFTIQKRVLIVIIYIAKCVILYVSMISDGKFCVGNVAARRRLFIVLQYDC